MTDPAETPPTTPDQLFAQLTALGIAYECHHHDPIFTVAAGEYLNASIPGRHCRNLFLRDKAEKMFLVVAANETAIDLKALPTVLGCGRLSFGSPKRLWRTLGVRPGSVCPFAIVNDLNHQVEIHLDASMMEAPLVCYHPLDNRMTIALTPLNLCKFIESTGHRPHITALP